MYEKIPVKSKRGTRVRKNADANCYKWYDMSLVSLKKHIDLRLSLFLKYSNDPIVRSRYFSTLKQYRKLRKLKSRQFRQEIINQLDTLYDNNPNEYWKLLDRCPEKCRCSSTKTSKLQNVIEPTPFIYNDSSSSRLRHNNST